MWPIVGTEAIAGGALSWCAALELTAVHPNVYLPNDTHGNVYVNTVAAWLWTGRRGIIAGQRPLRCTACNGLTTPRRSR